MTPHLLTKYQNGQKTKYQKINSSGEQEELARIKEHMTKVCKSQ